MAIHAICFDAFGTICHLRKPRHPYRQLLDSLSVSQRAEYAPRVMTELMSLRSLAELSGADVAIDELEAELARELQSGEMDSEWPEVVARLSALQLPIWVISNLALPYAEWLAPTLAGAVAGWSFSVEVGAVKPDARIFEHASMGLGLPFSKIAMVGDSWKSDVLGASGVGMSAIWLSRGRNGQRPNEIGSLLAVVERLERGDTTDWAVPRS
ncbi:HAD family hydrolase [Tuwongella immobilis]|uniref:HAD family hydrolase n=1 Tax=Tuwongella immobilis TaxID=692036 RepID=A0A6C2YUW7_9BACT|nr:HAD family hydrolase [Tuwongella immobilis]VIP05244.1 HAD hydrolase, IA, variant 1 family protein OS=Burkholderia pseudomallei GN=DP55_2533 PE=4 SV=1: HAD_2 [Tuwongella immobilis]VTS07844.1 HAD hydrolase, IA, variant 1 family protein OS=Burkholderia pseudomallei GN=DP55_2533 PE=4 SV=1: HAD_2 [Tuwongella immobilis]